MQDRICQVDETSCNARPDHLRQMGWKRLTFYEPIVGHTGIVSGT
jgi:hypothetical protein